jgi:FkbM family methyltransferase
MSSDSRLRRLGRALVPRGVRNVIRNPAAAVRASGQRIRAGLGLYDRYAVRPDWSVVCHPASTEAFRAQNDNPECRDELDGFIRLCRPGMVLLDAGSHFGIFVLAAVRYGGPEAVVLAVDPSEECAGIFGTNVRLANAGAQTIVVRAAVGDRDGQLHMLTTGAGGGFFLVASDGPRSDARPWPQYTLASLAAQASRPVTHLKIDVEGHEAVIVPGNRDWLRATRPLLFLELHGELIRSRNQDPLAVLTTLGECGYGRFECGGRPITPQAAAALPLTRIVCFAS